MCNEDILAGESEDAGECATERTVLDLLIDKHCQRPWTLREIALAIGSLGVAEDAVDELRASGLVHKTSDGFIFASRAAICYSEIQG